MFFNRQILTILALIFLRFDFAFAANSEWNKSIPDASETRLIASFYEENGINKLIAGVQFKLSPGWKIYGPDAGGIGMPPSFDLSSSTNYLEHRIIWPQAEQHEEKIGTENFHYSAYHQDITIPVEIVLQETKTPTNIELKLEYGICKDVCIPVSTKFSLNVPDEVDVDALKEIEKFYPTKLLDQQEQNLNKTSKKPGLLTIAAYIIFALLGGLILNVMPCVLPVLSIKLLSIIDHPNAKPSRVRLAFLATIFGIVSCFVVFATLASFIKFTGNELGWGLQFQNPNFIIFLIVIVTFLTANLLGKFELTFENFLATFLNKKINEGEKNKNIFIPNFLSGILATLLATPCSAPFLGSAISFGLTQDFLTIFVIFFFIGLGFSAPYIALLFAPKLVNLLPRPGMWMIRFKQLLAVFMAATVFWLTNILSGILGPGTAALSISLIAIAFLCFKIKDKILKYATIILLISIAFSLPKTQSKQAPAINQQDSEMMWQDFSENEIHRQIRMNKVVLVDVTADWCITCKFNKINVLQSEEITLMLKRGDFIGMRGDITKPNPEIMEFMRRHNRFAIPFNIVYGPGAPNGLLASELLSKDELLKLIKQAQ
jgi:suppressor for copper-sensitivity B